MSPKTKKSKIKKQVGLFGGSFNPFHLGHKNSLQTVRDKLGLDEIWIIPSYQSPGKELVEHPTPEERLKMAQVAAEAMGLGYQVLDLEIQRQGVSYTISTVKELSANFDHEFYLIMGLDQFEKLDTWKEYKTLLKLVNLIVTSRPGFKLPRSRKGLPEFIQPQIEVFKSLVVTLKTKKSVYLVQLKDKEISATEVRKRLAMGRAVKGCLEPAVESYIQRRGLYRHIGEKIGDFQRFTEFCAQELSNKKGLNVKGFDLRKLAQPSEFTLIASGTSTRHTRALADHLRAQIKKEYDINPLGVEGLDEGRWVAVDYGALIIHIFYDFVRDEYRIEDLWEEGKDLEIRDLSEPS